MPTSSFAASSYTPCRTASIAFATTAFSPMANAAITSLSAASCSMPITPRPIPSWRTVTPKALDRITPATFSSAPIAAAPCGASQACRAHPPISRSTVIRHDLFAAYFRHHRRRACAQPVANRTAMPIDSPQFRLQNWSTNKPDVLLAPRTQSARSSLPKRRSASVTQLSSK